MRPGVMRWVLGATLASAGWLAAGPGAGAGAGAPLATAATITDLADPAMATGVLSAIACPSATTCVAVGSGPFQGATAVASAAGGAWTWGPLTASSGDAGNFFSWSGVACPSTTTCLAVGADNTNGVVTTATLTGTTWAWTPASEVPNDASGAGTLAAIACPSATTCLAVGGDGNSLGTVEQASLTSAGWTWSPPTSLTAPSSGAGTLAAIACPSATTCVAVGTDGSQGVATSATRDGSTWTWSPEVRVDLGQASPGLGGLNAIACPSATTCVAVGSDNSDAVTTTGTADASGWTWSPEAIVTPDASGGGELEGVACPSAQVCVAVGSTIANGDVVSQQTGGVYSAEIATGSVAGGTVTWSPVSDIAPDPTGSDALAAVTCVSISSCLAVGAGGAYGQELFGAATLVSAPVVAPPTPTGLRAHRVGPVLWATWDAVAGASAYRCGLERASGSPLGAARTVAAPSCRFAGLGANEVVGVTVEALAGSVASPAAVRLVGGRRHALVCGRGHLTRRVTALFPSCPPGWRAR
ncbi:MAG: hypothetical protein ACP5OV_07875 [Acidimicrobiales bacterium]